MKPSREGEDGKMQTTSPPKLWTRDLALLLGSTVLLWTSFYFVSSVLPLYVVQRLRGGTALVGLLAGMLDITAIVTRPVCGWALDRWGRRQIQLLFLLLFSAVVFSYSLAQTVAILVIVRLAHGIPFAVTSTGGMTAAGDLSSAGRRGEGIGYYALAQTLALAAGPALGFVVLGQGQFARSFVVAALMAAGAFLLAWAIRYPPVRDPTLKLSLRSMWESRVGWLSLVVLFVSLGYVGILAFLPLYARELHIPNAGVFFSLYAVGMALVRPGAGRVFDRRGPRLVVGAGLLLLAVAYLCLAWCKSLGGYLSAGFLYGLGYGAVMPSVQAMAANVVPPARRGAANATVLALFDVGMAAGGYLLGLLAERAGGYAVLYVLSAGLLVIPAVLFFARAMPGYVKRET